MGIPFYPATKVGNPSKMIKDDLLIYFAMYQKYFFLINEKNIVFFFFLMLNEQAKWTLQMICILDNYTLMFEPLKGYSVG